MSHINVSVPHEKFEAMKWAAKTVLQDWLGLDIAFSTNSESIIRISLDDIDLTMPSLFAFKPITEPLQIWDIQSIGIELPETGPLIPVILGKPEVEITPKQINCGVDLLGSIFYVLSRYEETVLPDRDRHDRFPATASLAMTANFLTRPIVDEYVEILWTLMQRLWPRLNRQPLNGKVIVTCDVDHPFDRARDSVLRLGYSLGGDIFRRKDPGLAMRRVYNAVAGRRNGHRYDPAYTFEYYMRTCEKFGRTGAFYFIPDHSAGSIDGVYQLDEPDIISLIRKISQRGFELGVHCSYNTYRNPAQIVKERSRMIAAIEKAQVKSDVSGNRQHYLRWDTSQTPDHLDAAGFEYDTTGSFADAAGFRYGTARAFPMWSWRKMGPLKLKQRPLILMECSVISKDYLGLGYEIESLQYMLTLKHRALRYGGDFIVLWHNSHLLTPKDREFFETVIS